MTLRVSPCRARTCGRRSCRWPTSRSSRSWSSSPSWPRPPASSSSPSRPASSSPPSSASTLTVALTPALTSSNNALNDVRTPAAATPAGVRPAEGAEHPLQDRPPPLPLPQARLPPRHSAEAGHQPGENISSAANRSIGEVVQSRRRPLLGPSPS